jgi:hypothetical protein
LTHPPPADAIDNSAPSIGRTAKTIREETPENPDWLIPGMIALGTTTEVNGREKSGKGYFINYLLGALEREEPTMFGESVLDRPSIAVIYTEEPSQSLKEKFDRFDISYALVIYHWELSGLDWLEVCEYLVTEADRVHADLIFVDNISAATKTEDENGVEMARKVEPLTAKAKEHKLAVLYDRHQRKTDGKVRDKMRGGTALAGAVDVIVAMEEGPERKRKLTSWGRLWSTNWEKDIELTEDHDDYVEAGDYRESKLRERELWTAKEFAEAVNCTKDTAATYLKNHGAVSLAEGRGANGATLYRVHTTLPTLD